LGLDSGHVTRTLR